jgi:cytochrome c
MIRPLVLAFAVVESTLLVSGWAQPPVNRKQLFERRCGACHSLDRDREGPRLGGVYGRMAGTVHSFQYSDALRKAKIKWGAESLDKWLTDPEQVVPNNDMAFHLENAGERREIIAYLEDNSRK